ncbi:hypothetical protein [Paenibacillus sp. OSY-SE]|uniref:hypothetical protein n=1 Tax=Paenibacillus sp. OSY-SE TaxID=1196323 RepID=UPI0002FA9F56|nr:hypothetical protein [Paenibacillus sp. OSY-SE]
MANETEHLGLYKADPVADGEKTFNIDIMLNENWNRIDEAVGDMDTVPTKQKTAAGAIKEIHQAAVEAQEEINAHVNDTQKHVSDTDRPKWDGAAEEVSDPHTKELMLSPGVQVVEVENDTPFNFGEIKGRTLINLSTGLRNLERWKVHTTGAALELVTDVTDQGSASLKATVKASAPGEYTASWSLKERFDFGSIGDEGATFLLVARVRNGTAKRANVEILSGIFMGDLPVTDSTKFTTVRKAFSRSKNEPNTFDMQIRVTGQNGDTAYVDGIRVYRIADMIDDALIGHINNMDRDEANKLYPYVDAMTNVHNPYVAITGANQLPPFTKWEYVNTKAVVNGPYEYTQTEDDGTWTQVKLPLKAMTTHRISFDGTNGIRMRIKSSDEAITLWDGVSGSTFETGVFNEVRVYVHATAGTIRRPILTVGPEPQPFQPQQRSIWAAECNLAANPVDGSNPDTLFMGDDGLPYVLEKWKKVTLDGSLNWSIGDTTPKGAKQVKVAGLAVGSVPASGHASKYDGKYIPTGATGDAPDLQAVSVNGSFYISISNADSGWGDKHTPDADEIKAYFLGWKMYDTSGADPTAIGTYNRTDGLHKGWTPLQSYDGNIYKGGYKGSGTPNTIPSTANTTYYSKSRTWQPYRLQYLKTKPTIEPVKNYETGATLCAGANMVEVGSGIVLREKANPVLTNAKDMLINSSFPGEDSSKLKHRVKQIYSIHRDSATDWTWTRQLTDMAYGKERAIWYSGVGFDPSAVYHVTYTMLDPTLAAPILGTVAANLRGTVSDLVQHTGDMERRLSVVEMQKADAVEDTGWIKVPPLNGWIHYAAKPLRFRVKGNLLYIEGILQGGTTATTTQLFNLPITLKTAYGCWLNCITWTGANTVQPLQCSITTSGIMRINAGTADTYISFDGVGLLIEGLEVKKS